MLRILIFVSCCLISALGGFQISKYTYYSTLMNAYNICHPSKNTETYVSMVDKDDFVCFQVNIDTKKITKYAIVMPE